MYLVTGGCTDYGSGSFCANPTDSTEVLTAPLGLDWVDTNHGLKWVSAAPLPSRRDSLAGASINNKILIAGEC